MSTSKNANYKKNCKFEKPKLKKKKKNDYTKLYELDGIPMYNADAVKQFGERRMEYCRRENLLKRQRERQEIKDQLQPDNNKIFKKENK